MKKGKKPFFAKLLECQIVDTPKNVKGGNGPKPTPLNSTLKYPSDFDEPTTMKWPSDGDDDGMVMT